MSTRLTMRFEEEVYQNLVRLAKKENLSLTQFVKQIIEQGLDEREGMVEHILTMSLAACFYNEKLVEHAYGKSESEKMIKSIKTEAKKLVSDYLNHHQQEEEDDPINEAE